MCSSTVKLAVARQELDVTSERSVERRASRRRREREERVARLLLRSLCRLLQARQRRRGIGPRFEHRRVRRDGEEVLGEPVVDLAGEPPALLGDRTAELGGADRAPRADEQNAVRQQLDVVAERDGRPRGQPARA